VIESIGFDDRTFVSNNGTWFHSDELKVTERTLTSSMNYLNVQIIVDDPKVLTKPWKSGRPQLDADERPGPRVLLHRQPRRRRVRENRRVRKSEVKNHS
jgi:hypothetical protein